MVDSLVRLILLFAGAQPVWVEGVMSGFGGVFILPPETRRE